jgi:glycosyltransferase involved in cell wall biosynthesis
MLKKLETRPIRVMFLLTSMPIGGAETLLVNLVRRLDRSRIEPLVTCLKQKDLLGEQLTSEIPVFDRLINHKFDFAVAGRLKRLFLDQRIDALVTIGAGDKMFWGRLAARWAKVPVVLSALHSTGWPDGVGRLNRMLTPITDGFIAVARQHADYQVKQEKFPKHKVFLIPNGIDTEHFVFDETRRAQWRAELRIEPDAPVVGIVAALRTEKNHDLFLDSAKRLTASMPRARFVIAGDGPERSRLERLAVELGIGNKVHLIGSTQDVVGVLSMIDLFALTSHNEASPVSIMEALSCQRPVVATDVGSIDESVLEGQTGFLVPAGDADQMASRWQQVLGDPDLARRLGEQGRTQVIENSSLDSMTEGYMSLIEELLDGKTGDRDALGEGMVSWDFDLTDDCPVP